MAETYCKHPKLSICEQVDAAERELQRRHKSYPYKVKNGDMTDAEFHVALNEMRAIRNTLRVFERLETEVRATIARCLEAERDAADQCAREVSDAETGEIVPQQASAEAV